MTCRGRVQEVKRKCTGSVQEVKRKSTGSVQELTLMRSHLSLYFSRTSGAADRRALKMWTSPGGGGRGRWGGLMQQYFTLQLEQRSQTRGRQAN